MAKYKALQRGYDGLTVREPGEVFEFEGGPGAWMEKIDEKSAQAKAKGQAPAQPSASQKPAGMKPTGNSEGL